MQAGTTRASGHKTGSNQKYAESTQLRLGLLKDFLNFPDILFLVDPKILVTGSSGHIKGPSWKWKSAPKRQSTKSPDSGN